MDKVEDVFEKRVINAVRLAGSCICNIACYRAAWSDINGEKKLIINREFWVRANANFLDIATLDWYKLFLDKDEKSGIYGDHHWRNIFSECTTWLEDMLIDIKISNGDYNLEANKIIKYRNKHLAHLDIKSNQLFYPHTNIMLNTVSYFYDQLRTSSCTRYLTSGLYDSAKELFLFQFNDALNEINLIN